MLDHVTALQAQAPQLIASAKEKLLNGEDDAVDERLRDTIAATAVPVAALIAAVAPSNDNKVKATGSTFFWKFLFTFLTYYLIII